MIKIDYPNYQPSIKTIADKDYIFDTFRKKWILLTPEEWVRQNFLQYLTRIKNYPASIIAIEKEIRLGELKKRFDIVVYDKSTRPWMLIECKEMNTPLNEMVLHQAIRYDWQLQVEYLVITNGSHCFAFRKSEDRLQEIFDLPVYV